MYMFLYTNKKNKKRRFCLLMCKNTAEERYKIYAN